MNLMVIASLVLNLPHPYIPSPQGTCVPIRGATLWKGELKTCYDLF
jgi:hypothetical protein